MKESEENIIKIIDEILKFISSKQVDKIKEREIIDVVGFNHFKGGVFDVLPKYTFTEEELIIFFRKSLAYLIDEGYIQCFIEFKNEVFYTITVKGLIAVKDGGVGEILGLPKTKFKFEKILFWIAVIAFILNTIIQMISFFNKSNVVCIC